MRYLAVEHSLIHPKQITSAPDNSSRRQDAVNRAIAKSTAQHEEFANKSVEQWQSQRRQHDEQKKRRIRWHDRCQAAEFGDLVSMASLIQNSRQHEQSASRNTMRQHDKSRAVESCLSKAEEAKHNKTQVADRRICDQLFHVGLH